MIAFTTRAAQLLGGLLVAAAVAACAASPTSRALPSAPAAAVAGSPGRATARARATNARSAIQLDPAVAALLGTGPISRLAVVVREPGYSGGFTLRSGCAKVARVTPSSLAKAGRITLFGLHAGACALTIGDADGHTTVLHVSDTVVSIALGAGAISPGSKTATVTLIDVNGKTPAKGLRTTRTSVLVKCAAGCTLPGPQAPPGYDRFTVAVNDAKAHVLAYGKVAGRVRGAQPLNLTPRTVKYIASVAIASFPPAAAGTPFASPQPLALAIDDIDGNPILGTYASPVLVSDSDTTHSTSLSVGTAKASDSVAIVNSTQVVNLSYDGFAIAPQPFGISAGGYASNTASFAPSLGAILTDAAQSTGADGQGPSGAYELDFPTAGGAYSATVNVTQPGWSEAPFSKTFTYAQGDAGIVGDADNCALFSISPASGTATTYVVSIPANDQVNASGACLMTIGGGAGQQTKVYLTLGYSNFSIHGIPRP